MINKLTLFTYTHSTCLDIHEIYLNRINKYFPELKKHILTCNSELDYENIKTVVYDNNDYFSNHIINAISNIDTDFLIYSQEDYILYNNVDIDKINYCISILENDKSIPFIRLIWSGIGNRNHKYNEILYYIGNSEYYYSTQITIWRKKVLEKFYSENKIKSIFDEVSLSKPFFELNKNGLVYYNKGKKIGGHYNSTIYPYISTAIVKKKWNYSEYKDELDILFKEFNIDPNIRGFYKTNLKVKLYRLLKKLKS